MERVALSSKILLSDEFLSLTNEAKILYIHLGLSTDKSGRTRMPKTITHRILKLDDKYLNELKIHGYVYEKDAKTYVKLEENN